MPEIEIERIMTLSDELFDDVPFRFKLNTGLGQAVSDKRGFPFALRFRDVVRPLHWTSKQEMSQVIRLLAVRAVREDLPAVPAQPLGGGQDPPD